MKFPLFGFVALLWLGFGFVGARAADERALAALQAADDERVSATVAGDRSRLTAVLADDLRYAHSSGAVDGKGSFLEAIETKRLKYLQLIYEERSFSFPSPQVALMTGRAKVKIGKGDTATDLHLGFLAVWREENGHWRILAWQSCKLPEPDTSKP